MRCPFSVSAGAASPPVMRLRLLSIADLFQQPHREVVERPVFRLGAFLQPSVQVIGYMQVKGHASRHAYSIAESRIIRPDVARRTASVSCPPSPVLPVSGGPHPPREPPRPARTRAGASAIGQYAPSPTAPP